MSGESRGRYPRSVWSGGPLEPRSASDGRMITGDCICPVTPGSRLGGGAGEGEELGGRR